MKKFACRLLLVGFLLKKLRRKLFQEKWEFLIRKIIGFNHIKQEATLGLVHTINWLISKYQ
jgi:hypothetical protein